MALGTCALRFQRTSPVRVVPGIASFFNVEVPSPGDPYTLNRGMVEFGDEPPFANRGALDLPGHLRLCGPRALALHPHDRPVGQPVLALLSLLRGALGQGGLHRDRYQARSLRQGRARHVAADAAIERFFSTTLVSRFAGL